MHYEKRCMLFCEKQNCRDRSWRFENGKKTKNKNSFTKSKRHLSDAQIKYSLKKRPLLRVALYSVCDACLTRLNNIIRVDTTYVANKAKEIT